MLRIKKLIAAVLLFATLMGAAVTGQAANAAAELSISSGAVKAGESVTLTASIAGNPGLSACLIYIYYDTSVFTVEPSSDLRAAGVFAASGGLIGNSIALARENGRYFGDADKDGTLALLYNSSGINTTGDGAMFTITLHARADAAGGDYAIGLGCSAADTRNQDNEEVALSFSGGAVTVSGTAQAPSGGTDPEPGVPDTGESAEENAAPVFLDVDGHWAEEYILKAASLGLIEGYDDRYWPDDQMTRAECVTILWRAMGEPTPTGKASFTDLEARQTWYHEAVAWAEENGVVDGVGNGKFDPNGTVTREQLAAILHRLSGEPSGMELLLSGVYDGQFSDSGEVSDWAKNSVYWCVYSVIYCGQDSADVGSQLHPRQPADRAQIAVMMVRYLERVE